MPRDEAAAVGWPAHLSLVPPPNPEESAAHLRVLIHNVSDWAGPNSPDVSDLKAKLAAVLAEIKARP